MKKVCWKQFLRQVEELTKAGWVPTKENVRKDFGIRKLGDFLAMKAFAHRIARGFAIGDREMVLENGRLFRYAAAVSGYATVER